MTRSADSTAVCFFLSVLETYIRSGVTGLLCYERLTSVACNSSYFAYFMLVLQRAACIVGVGLVDIHLGAQMLCMSQGQLSGQSLCPVQML
ncbi:hypothetical protein BDV40DRAFT_255612 [Aspergillus tamarii]|uniref:Uncharacterized protein n=1 Tax=Aspergillus tamarii TaxID=41984 RepID=A0A5N6V707_ASPTM|nr:hypothetical protein BDV40DRAFT_255612 [Aspergillus tamarii]